MAKTIGQVDTISAADFREDLLAAGLGDGRHAFHYPVPSSIRDGRPHALGVRVAGTAQHLEGSPATVTCAVQ